MFRDETTDIQKFSLKFKLLNEKLQERIEIQLNSEYHRELKSYIIRLYRDTCENETFSNKDFLNIKEIEMSNLNRLQKLKNGTSYKKEKHKAKDRNEDWG